MAHILLLTLVFSPDGVSTSTLLSDLAVDLHEMGHRLTVLTTTPHYNLDAETRARQPLRAKWGSALYASMHSGIPVYHAAIPAKGERVGARMKDYLRFHAISTVAGFMLAHDVDIILAPSPPLTIGLSAWVLGLGHRAPFVYNVQEIYPDVAVSLGVLTNPRLIRALEEMERFIYDRAARVTVISEWFQRRLREKGVPESKLLVIPNFVDTEYAAPRPRGNEIARAYGLDDKFVVQYAGNIGLTQGFETILEASERLAHLPDLRFLIVGDGARRAWLEEQLRQRPNTNCILLPYQPHSLAPYLYASSDVCLVPLKRGMAQQTFPSKTYTIMAAARPVIASTDADSELAWVVGEADCGWVAPPEDPAALAAVIEEAYRRRECLPALGENGRRYVEAHHSRQAIAAQYDALIRGIVDARHG